MPTLSSAVFDVQPSPGRRTMARLPHDIGPRAPTDFLPPAWTCMPGGGSLRAAPSPGPRPPSPCAAPPGSSAHPGCARPAPPAPSSWAAAARRAWHPGGKDEGWGRKLGGRDSQSGGQAGCLPVHEGWLSSQGPLLLCSGAVYMQDNKLYAAAAATAAVPQRAQRQWCWHHLVSQQTAALGRLKIAYQRRCLQAPRPGGQQRTFDHDASRPVAAHALCVRGGGGIQCGAAAAAGCRCKPEAHRWAAATGPACPFHVRVPPSCPPGCSRPPSPARPAPPPSARSCCRLG